jgi:hypothetical protein
MTLDASLSAWLERRNGDRVQIQEMCTIGRGSGNTIVIPSDQVSRRHAVIRRAEDGTYELMDMGSSNGTYVNGSRLSRPATLANCSIIEIGGERLTFRIAGGQSPERDQTGFDSACWLLSIEAVQPGHREPLTLLGDKTYEGWSERCQRLLSRLRAKALRPGGEALLLYWPGETNGASVLAALRALLGVQQAGEEFHLALHHATMKFRRSAAGDIVPGGLGAIHTLQMQRLLRLAPVQVLVSRAAMTALGESSHIRPLSEAEKAQLPPGTELFTLGLPGPGKE